MDLLKAEVDPGLVSEIIRALGYFKDPDMVESLLPYLDHDDDVVSAWTMRALAGFADNMNIRDALVEIIDAKEGAVRASGECDLRTALAVENLANYPDEDTVRFLVFHIHHQNPCLRRVVAAALISIGADSLPELERCIETGDKDEKIMAANMIGFIGNKKGGDILLAQLDREEGLETNLRFAAYEALGRIDSIRSVVGLCDGLSDPDELVLMAVVTGLDGLCNPGIVNKLRESISKGDSQSERILKAVVAARAKSLFVAIYGFEPHAEPFIRALLASGDKEAVAVLREELEKMEGERPAADVKRLQVDDAEVFSRRLVAADDSKAMLFFYKSVAADMGVELVTAKDGKEALGYMQSATEVDLLITDLNMPNMDGIELTRELRKMSEWSNLPILMATTESEQSQTDLAGQAGVTGFISKPFSKEDLRKKVEEMFGS
jgi:CheY-like chemotaxis protein